MQVEVEAVTSTPAAAGGTDESTPEVAGPPEAPTGSRRRTVEGPCRPRGGRSRPRAHGTGQGSLASALRNPYYPSNDWALLQAPGPPRWAPAKPPSSASGPASGGITRARGRCISWRCRTGSSRPSTASCGASAVNFVAMACCAGLALRRERAQALVLLVGLAVLEHGLGIAGLTDPWNPILPILPFALYCLLCIELSVAPRRWMLPAAVAAGSFVVQAHLGFAQPVVIVGAASFAVWYLRQRHGGPRRRGRRSPGRRHLSCGRRHGATLRRPSPSTPAPPPQPSTPAPCGVGRCRRRSSSPCSGRRSPSTRWQGRATSG